MLFVHQEHSIVSIDLYPDNLLLKRLKTNTEFLVITEESKQQTANIQFKTTFEGGRNKTSSTVVLKDHAGCFWICTSRKFNQSRLKRVTLCNFDEKV